MQADHDFSTLDALIEGLYAAVSGPGGLDVALQRRVFLPDGELLRTGMDESGRPWRKPMDLDAYERDTRDFFRDNAFHEFETARTVVHCEPFAHVLSEYEATRGPDSGERFLSGVNSILCWFDGQRWWVYQLTWNHRA